MAITWKNIQPNFSGIGAGMASANRAQMNSFKMLQDSLNSAGQIGLDRQERETVAEQRVFDRENDLLQRDLTNQEITAGLLEAKQAPELFKSQQAARQAQTNRSNQLANQSATTFQQEQQLRQDSADLNKLYIDAKSASPNKSEREIITGLQNHLSSTDRQYNPTATANVFKSLSAGYQPTSSEESAILRRSETAKRNHEINKINTVGQHRLNAATAKAQAKNNKNQFYGTTNNADIDNESAIRNIDKSNLDAWFGFETDDDTQQLVRNSIKPYLKLGSALAPLVRQATNSSGYFDSAKFTKLATQKNLELGLAQAKEEYKNTQILNNLQGKR